MSGSDRRRPSELLSPALTQPVTGSSTSASADARSEISPGRRHRDTAGKCRSRRPQVVSAAGKVHVLGPQPVLSPPHAHRQAHAHTHGHTRMHSHTRTRTHMGTHVHTDTHTCTHSHAHTDTPACTHTCTHTCAHRHTCTHSHAHTARQHSRPSGRPELLPDLSFVRAPSPTAPSPAPPDIFCSAFVPRRTLAADTGQASVRRAEPRAAEPSGPPAGRLGTVSGKIFVRSERGGGLE